MKELHGRTALVTGASRGLGVYIARALAAEGMNLILAARSADALDKVAEDLRQSGTKVLSVPTDLGDRASLEALVARAEGEGGGVDLLVNNAGLEWSMAYDEIPLESIDDVIEINLRAPLVLSRLFLPKMLERGRGHIVNVSSVAGYGPVAYNEPYCATKAGLIGFTRSLRATAKLLDYPVNCSVVSPGFVEDAGMYNDMASEFGVKAPVAFGTSSPEKLASAVVRAAKRDVPEIIVNPTPIRPLIALALFAPRLALWIVMKLGGGFFGVIADDRARQAQIPPGS
jgi:short-subunit dehydrogenase